MATFVAAVRLGQAVGPVLAGAALGVMSGGSVFVVGGAVSAGLFAGQRLGLRRMQ